MLHLRDVQWKSEGKKKWCMSNCRSLTLRTRQQNLTKTHMTPNQTAKCWQVGPTTPTIMFPANLLTPPLPSPHLTPPLAQPYSPHLLEGFLKLKNAVGVFFLSFFFSSAGCACRLMPTPGFSRRPVLFLALISGCWKFGNRCLKPCKRF